MGKSKQNDFQIDAVITWVNGDDKAHKKKMEPYLNGKRTWEDKNFQTRFNQVNEIEFAVKSIIKKASFIRNIFIVTDEQTPSFLSSIDRTDYPNVKIIDHKDIFVGFEPFLPVFNSRAIETMLHRIPNLSEHFIYFNDDIFLIKKTKISDFFKNGYPMIRGQWTLFDENIVYKRLHQKIMKLLGRELKNKKYGFKRGQQSSAKRLGFEKRYFRINHTPSPTRKSTLKNYFEEHPNMLLRNIQHKFRNPEQYGLQPLTDHIEIKNKTCLLKEDYQLVYIGSYKKPLIWYRYKMYKANQDKNILFLCMQSLDLCPKHKLDFLLGWMRIFLSIHKV